MDQTAENTRIPMQKMELAARHVDKAIGSDCAAPSLAQLMGLSPESGPTASGLTDHDYPVLGGGQFNMGNMAQVKVASHVPLPPEILEHFNHVQCHCMMGLFPEINRAWLTVDSDIYVWTYNETSDLAYYDGVSETILCVGLIKPKPGVFHNFIKYLLVLTTAVDIVVLGVTFTANARGSSEEIQLIPDPVFTIPTDGASISCIMGTSLGRLFLGSKDGSLYEITYQAASGWFGKRCKKINHSTSALSFLVPSFINAALTEEDGIVQIVVDNTRHILYVLTEKGAIEVCDLGEKGTSFYRITKVSQNALVHQAMNIVKTLDSQNFRPIVSISAIEAAESAQLNLVAVSQTGVRFYMSTCSLAAYGSGSAPGSPVAPVAPASPSGGAARAAGQRPYTLQLQHVRLPPGYSANVTVRPRSVHLAHHRDRALVLLSTVGDKDVLWCAAADLFPFGQHLTEAYSTVQLDGVALAIAEVRHQNPLAIAEQESMPLVVRQHFEPPKKYVVLTSQGVHIFLKVRPVDILRQLLLDSHGEDSEAVKTFFMIEREEQACASSLILASLECPDNFEIADYAARAFFVFGGEPKVAGGNMLNQSVGPVSASMFSPKVISTPAPRFRQPQFLSQSSLTPQQQLQQSSYMQQTVAPQNATQQASLFDMNSPFVFSAKHNGLYIYLGRILRPIWNRRCVEKVLLGHKTAVNVSTITSDECVQILHNLNALHNFIVTNTQLSLCNTTGQPWQPQLHQQQHQQALMMSLNTTAAGSSTVRASHTVQDAQLEERQSLDALKLFVCHCCQMLGFWRILCEHQAHDLMGSLPEGQQQILQNTTFKDLFLYGQDVCAVLISALVNSYLGDNASVDSISLKLREVCPTLYKPEDAAFSKASEILTASRGVQNLDEKEDMVCSALELCKSIAPNINLEEVCKHFVHLKAYKAVTELCVVCAKKTDPENIAEHYYKHMNPIADQQGYNLYQKRMGIYGEVTKMLDAVHNEQMQQLQSDNTSLNMSQQGPSTVSEASQTLATLTVQTLISDILEQPDELLHVALYEWMMLKNMTSALIKVDNSSLETFLLHASQQNDQNTNISDMLWKYYETNGNYAQAAKVLNNMASKAGPGVPLKKRLEYLARAIMSMRSDKVGYAPYLGVFLKDLEDKLEIAMAQEQILDAVSALVGVHPNAEEAIVALNSGLYQISQLYENFAEPMQLWECQLAIIDCAGYTDSGLIEKIWRQIFKKELSRANVRQSNEALSAILSKVKILAHRYGASVHCFPLGYIVRELEIISAGLHADESLVPKALLTMSIPFLDLLDIYNKLLMSSTADRFWQQEENEFHLPESISTFIGSFLDTHESYNNIEKRKIIAQCQDIVAAILSNLYSKPNTEQLVNILRGIQSRLSRL